jgi:hypothetical protein
MSRPIRPLLVLSFVCLTPAWAGVAGEPDKPLSRPYLEGVRAEIQHLRAETIRLQDDVVHHPAAQKDRDLYRFSESALAAIARFEKTVKPEARSAELLKQYGDLDNHVHTLIAVVHKATPHGVALQRAADRVHVANEELYYVLANGDRKHLGQLIKRQGIVFVGATADLQRAAKFTFDDIAGRATVIDDVAQLTIAAERFEKSLSNEADLKQRQADFADVNKAWTRVVHGLGLLKPAENFHLLRSAGQVDRVHERMYRLLDIKGKRPSLSVQS